MTSEEAMDAAFVVLWMTLAVLGGFLFAWVSREDIRISAAVVSSFVAIGLGLGNLLGNPLWPTLIVSGLAGGLAWACLEHYRYARAVARIIKQLLASVHTGNHMYHSGPPYPKYRETWSERLARWGFPSQRQMERDIPLKLGAELGRGYIQLSTRYVQMGDRPDPRWWAPEKRYPLYEAQPGTGDYR